MRLRRACRGDSNNVLFLPLSFWVPITASIETGCWIASCLGQSENDIAELSPWALAASLKCH